MSGPGHRFDPRELRVPGDPEPSISEQADALLAARELEAVSAEGIRPTDDFTDRVMAAITLEPAPRLVVRAGSSVRGGRAGAFVIAVRDAWNVGTHGGRPFAVRAQALALVLIVVLATGALAGAAAVGVGAVFGQTPNQSPNNLPAPTTDETPRVASTPTVEPSQTAEPTETVEPSQTAEPTGTAEPAKTPRPIETVRPTRTPRATETPTAGETVEPTETPDGSDDHGGDGSGDGSGTGSGSSGPG